METLLHFRHFKFIFKNRICYRAIYICLNVVVSDNKNSINIKRKATKKSISYVKRHASISKISSVYDVDNEAINTELDTSDDDLNSNKAECEESFNLLRWKQLGRL